MRALAVFAALLLGGGAALAQHRGAAAPSGFGNVVFPGTGYAPRVTGFNSGFGNVVFPGGAPRPNTFSITDPTFARGLGGIVSGRAPYGSMSRGGRSNRTYVYVPYAYPVYAGGGYDPYMDQAYPPQPNTTVVYPQAQPPVVVNQVAPPAQPMVQEVAPDTSDVKVYQGPTRSSEEMAAAEPKTTYYLIAFKDHSIYSALAYFVQGDTLHYFTEGNVHNQVSLSLVDQPLTEQLNHELGKNFNLSVTK